MKLKLDEDGKPVLINEDEKWFFVIEEPDGKEKRINPIKWVKMARATSSEAADYRKKLMEAERKLNLYKDNKGNLIDHNILLSHFKESDKTEKNTGENKYDHENKITYINEQWKKKLDNETSRMTEEIERLKVEAKKAALLSAEPLSKTIFAKMGPRYLLTEFGDLIDNDGNPLGRDGKPIMQDTDPTKHASVAEAAKIWLETYPGGADKVLISNMKGGSGEIGSEIGSVSVKKAGNAESGESFLSIVQDAFAGK